MGAIAAPDMRGRLCLVTGATSGIGFETARALAKLGAHVIVAGRDGAKLARIAQEVRAGSGGGAIETLQADLLRQSEVRRMAEEFRRRHDRLDVLVNNAGAIFFERRMTPDGFERTWALNHLAYFLLTLLLLEPLRAAPSARVINVASAAHERGTLDFDNLQSERLFTPMRAYSRSKLANVLFTYALARRLRGGSVTANCLHPGVVATGFGHDTKGLFKIGLTIARLFFISAKRGAKTSIFLASSPSIAGKSGGYYARSALATSSATSRNEALQERLWKLTAGQTKTEDVVL